MAEYYDDSLGLGNGAAFWQHEENGYQCGTYSGPEGMVDMYMQTIDPHFSLRAISGGRLYTRSYQRVFSTRYTAKLARQFLNDIASE